MREEPPVWLPDTRSALAIFLVAALVVMTFTLIFKTTPVESDVLKVLIGGFMTTGFASVIGFYFGSSSSSKDKDAPAVTVRVIGPAMSAR